MIVESGSKFLLVFAITFAIVFSIGLIIILLINRDKNKVAPKSNNQINEDQQVFQKVFDCFVDFLPNNWQRFAAYYAKVDNMIDLKYFVDTGNGYVGCFNLPDYDDDKFEDITYDVDGLLRPVREKLPKNKKWNVFTMFVTNDGKFKTNYSYDDISKNFIEYRDKWEKENIKNK